MPREITPTIQRWLLGQRLRELREQANIKAAEAGKEIGVSASTMSRIELGKQTIKPPYVKLLCLLYGTDQATAAELMQLAEDALRPEWYAALARKSPDWFKQYLGYESVASTIHTYESELVPGLLQVADYTRAIARASRATIDEKELDNAIELRRGRQERAQEGGVELRAVLNEAVLLRPVGGRDVMRAQLRHIAELATLPNVTVQVLPFAAGEHPSMTAPFTALGFEHYPAMNCVYLDSGRAGLYLEGRADLDQYQWRFDRLSLLALAPEKSRDLLIRVGEDL